MTKFFIFSEFFTQNDVTNRKIEPVVAFQKWLNMTKNGHFSRFNPIFSKMLGYEPIFLERHYKKSQKYQSLGNLPPKLATKMPKPLKITFFIQGPPKCGGFE